MVEWLEKVNIVTKEGKIKKIILPLDETKRILELIGLPHILASNEFVVIEKDNAFAFLASLGINKKEDLERVKKLVEENKKKDIFVITDKNMPNGISTEDIAKRILDYGIYAPTIYFPLIISGAMMIEPTETESKSSLDNFIDIMEKIYREAESNPEILRNAPHNMPVKRLDAVLAARKPVLHD